MFLWVKIIQLKKFSFNNFSHLLLHRLPLLVAAGFSVSLHWLQLHPSIFSIGQNLPVLVVHGSHGASHKLPKSIQIDVLNTLPVGDFSLERLFISHHLQEWRLWLQKLGVQRLRNGRRGEAVPAELLLVYISVNHHRRLAKAQIQSRILFRDNATAFWLDVVCSRTRTCREYCDVGQCSQKGISRFVDKHLNLQLCKWLLNHTNKFFLALTQNLACLHNPFSESKLQVTKVG